MKQVINCRMCGSKLSGKQSQYCSTKCKNKAHQSYEAQKSRGLKRKLSIVNELGGRCSNCKYKKNLSALTFHHKDPQKKNFKLDMRSLSNRKQSNIDDELKKCILLCHNCHTELHYPQHDLEKLSSSRLL